VAFPGASCEVIDPRIRRTRQLLLQGLEKLLEKKEFDQISVQDIAEAATVNRATFYDHYSDKFSLLKCMVGSRFHELLAERQVDFDGCCGSALKAIILALCDYLSQVREYKPHMESAIIAVLERIILNGLQKQPPKDGVPVEMMAAAASWAMYGAAKQWAETPDHCPSEQVVDTVVKLVGPILLESA